MQAPASSSGDSFSFADNLGALLYITVHGQVVDIETKHGPASPIQADVAVLDGPNKGDVAVNTLLFPKVLIARLKPVIGSDDTVVVGRLVQTPTTKGSPAWDLAPPTEADFEVARRFEAYVRQKAAEEEAPF
jgi:hypothetical protein